MLGIWSSLEQRKEIEKQKSFPPKEEARYYNVETCEHGLSTNL
jgi:hypothetical protein